MSDPHDRTNGPFLALLFFAFILALIVLLGPNIRYLASGQLPLGGGRGAIVSGGGFDPFTPIINGLDSFGQAIGRFFGGFVR
ncbi:MAG TPA: hypothetical protein VIH16_07545 [Bellilinea sp.]